MTRFFSKACLILSALLCSVAQSQELTRAPDDTTLWTHTAGPPAGPTVIFVHGGPGYNSYTFQRGAGRLLERHLRMVYFDSRGCGRSSDPPRASGYSLQAMVDDIETVRRHCGRDKVGLVGHSFGGLVALKYAKKYPGHVSSLVLVDTTNDLSAAFAYQIRRAAQVFPRRSPQIRAIQRSGLSPIKQLDKVYALLGRVPLQRALMFVSDRSLATMDDWDRESGLKNAHDGSLPKALRADGTMDDHQPELNAPVKVPTFLFAGRLSHCIGHANIKTAARRWRARLLWFEGSGHFPYLDEPGLFAKRLDQIFLQAPPTPLRHPATVGR